MFGIPSVSAQTLGLEETGIQYGEYTGLATTDIRITIANIVRIALGLLGIIAVLIILYAGFLWMTAGGDAERVAQAKRTMAQAVIGLIIIMSAFALASFILRRLIEGPEIPSGAPPPPSGFNDTACIGLSATCPGGALGNGIIESHYPARNATGVPRNTRIVVTFKEPIDPASLVVGGSAATVAIVPSNALRTNPQFPERFDQSLTSDDIEVAGTEDGRTFGFVQKNCPPGCIGSPSENAFYTVALRGGNDGVKKADGTAAFSGTFNSGYLWEFRTSTTLDVTPPKVTFVVPEPGSREVPRNSLIQANFDEAIDPMSLGPGVEVAGGAGPVAGEVLIGNGYRSAEFRTNDACGTNSCGEQVFCLPGNTRIGVRLKADALASNPPAGVFPPNGVTDMAGNSLDGDGDGSASGPPDDDFAYAFDTGNTIDLTPPIIIEQAPGAREGNVPREGEISATFSKLLSTTSVTTDSARLIPGPGGAPTNFMSLTQHLSAVPDAPPTRTKAYFQHDLLSTDQLYSSYYTSGIRDTRQNCYFPGRGPQCAGDEPFCCDGFAFQTECGFLQ